MKKVHSLKIAQSIKLKCYQFTWQNGGDCLNTSDVSNSPDKVAIGFSTQEPRFKDKIWTASWLKKKKKTEKKNPRSVFRKTRQVKATFIPFSYPSLPQNAPKSISPTPSTTWLSLSVCWDLRKSLLQGSGVDECSSRVHMLESWFSAGAEVTKFPRHLLYILPSLMPSLPESHVDADATCFTSRNVSLINLFPF